MITCGKRKRTKRNEALRQTLDKNDMKDIEMVVATLTKKYLHSVYSYEIDDLKQTIWYLIFMAKTKYDPQKEIPFKAWAHYYANMKLTDHFWRGANFPETKGAFTLLHTRAFGFVEFD